MALYEYKRILLCATLDPTHPLSKLRANGLVWSTIFKTVDDDIAERHIRPTEDAYKILYDESGYGWTSYCQFTFPPPTGININMMPIDLCDLSTYPPFLEPYRRLLWVCMRFSIHLHKTAYLTIHESNVPIGETQRRPGLHIESPTILERGGTFMKQDFNNPTYWALSWGCGAYCGGDLPMDGIFMASTVSNSAQVFPAHIHDSHLVADRHGGIEPLRAYLGTPYKIKKNELVWMTDKTPHESLPVFPEEPTAPDAPPPTHVYRQFFRLVLGKVSVWYANHNTANPLYTPEDVIVSYDNKFAGSTGSSG